MAAIDTQAFKALGVCVGGASDDLADDLKSVLVEAQNAAVRACIEIASQWDFDGESYACVGPSIVTEMEQLIREI